MLVADHFVVRIRLPPRYGAFMGAHIENCWKEFSYSIPEELDAFLKHTLECKKSIERRSSGVKLKETALRKIRRNKELL